MGSGGPVADSAGNVYVSTGNGPWDGKTAFSDSILKFSPTLKLEDYFTPDNYAYLNCNDGDLGAGGLVLIPGSKNSIGGGKRGKDVLGQYGKPGQGAGERCGRGADALLRAGSERGVFVIVQRCLRGPTRRSRTRMRSWDICLLQWIHLPGGDAVDADHPGRRSGVRLHRVEADVWSGDKAEHS